LGQQGYDAVAGGVVLPLLVSFALAQSRDPNEVPREAPPYTLAEVDPTGAAAFLGVRSTSAEFKAFAAEHQLKKRHDFHQFYGPGLCMGSVEKGILSQILFEGPDSGNPCESDSPAPWTGALPLGLNWGQTREEVVALLGPPYEDDSLKNCWRSRDDMLLVAKFENGHLSSLIESRGSPDDWTHPSANVDVGYVRRAIGPAPAVVARATLAPPPAVVTTAQVPVIVTPTPTPPVVTPPPAAPAPIVATTPAAPLVLPPIDAPIRTGARAAKEAAVVIGLEAYPFLGAGVPYAHRDAQAFADLLIYTRGVPGQKIQTLQSGAREQILSAVERAARDAGPGGLVWVYFAGHGAANPSNGERVLLGNDVRADVRAFESRGVAVSEIERTVAATGTEVGPPL